MSHQRPCTLQVWGAFYNCTLIFCLQLMSSGKGLAGDDHFRRKIFNQRTTKPPHLRKLRKAHYATVSRLPEPQTSKSKETHPGNTLVMPRLGSGNGRCKLPISGVLYTGQKCPQETRRHRPPPEKNQGQPLPLIPARACPPGVHNPANAGPTWALPPATGLWGEAGGGVAFQLASRTPSCGCYDFPSPDPRPEQVPVALPGSAGDWNVIAHTSAAAATSRKEAGRGRWVGSCGGRWAGRERHTGGRDCPVMSLWALFAFPSLFLLE